MELIEAIVGALEELTQVPGGETASKGNQLVHVLLHLLLYCSRFKCTFTECFQTIQLSNLVLISVCSVIKNLAVILKIPTR